MVLFSKSLHGDAFIRAIRIKRERLIGPLIFILFLFLLLPFTTTEGESWNDYSHAAAIESLVERGT